MTARILVIGQLPPPVHGSNVMTERFLAALEQSGYQTEIVEKTFSKSMAEVGRVAYRKALKVPDLYRRVADAISRRKPDCCVYFISVGLRSLLVDCLLLALLRKRKVPYLLYFHGKGYPAYESLRYLPVRHLVRAALANARGGLVLGETLKEDVNHCIPDERLLVLPNGIPQLDDRQGALVKKDAAQVSIVFLSNLIPTKGPMRFLKMARRVREQEPGVRFTMAGRHASDHYLAQLKQFIAREGLGECVESPGPVYGADKDLLLRQADIMVFPTNFDKETFGVVNIEAMQWGVPVVSSPVGAIPEIIRDGVNGFIVDPEDISALSERVLQLVRDPVLRRRMGDAGRKLFARHYSLDAYHDNVRRAMEFFLPLAGSAHPGKALPCAPPRLPRR